MTLPLTRNTTYTPASPVKSADLNDIQDAIIGGKHGALEMVLGAAGWQPDIGVSGGMILVGGVYAYQCNAFGVFHREIPVVVGMKLREVRFSMLGNNIADVTAINVYKLTAANVMTSIGTIAAIINEPAVWATKTIDVNPDYTFLTGESCLLSLAISASAIHLGRVSAFYEKTA